MTPVTRRKAIGTAVALGAGAAGSARAASAPQDQRAPDMDIERYDLSPVRPGIPRISYAVVHGGLVYLAGVSAPFSNRGDVAEQTRLALQHIDVLLAKAGTSKSKLLSAQVWLTDMANFAAHNDAWNEWVDHANPPVRACLLSPRLYAPGLLVEIMATAAK